jgi:hypothetical protein
MPPAYMGGQSAIGATFSSAETTRIAHEMEVVGQGRAGID